MESGKWKMEDGRWKTETGNADAGFRTADFPTPFSIFGICLLSVLGTAAPPLWPDPLDPSVQTRAAAAKRAVAALEKEVLAELHGEGTAPAPAPIEANEETEFDLITRTFALYRALVETSGAGFREVDGYIRGRRVNVRRGPGKQHPRFAVVARGTPVWILQERSGWTQVQFDNSNRGWVASSLLRRRPASAWRGREGTRGGDFVGRDHPWITEALQHQGVPYVWGGASPRGFDCSGLIQYIARKYGQQVPHSAAELAKLGSPVQRSAVQPGDLVFFANTYKPGISHVGISVGEGKFIHASSNAGVIISSLRSAYYREHYAGARRLLTVREWTEAVR